MKKFRLLFVLFAAAAGSLFASNPAQAQVVKALSPQPAAEALQPGLGVCYIREFVRHINEMIEWEKHKDCSPGEPLLELNSNAGKGNVLTSSGDDGVMAKIDGMIHFEKPGFYSFAFESNDGVRLEIDGQKILEDPDVHGDRFSDIGEVHVPEAGWHALTIRYFERKNTSTLRFYWLPPGAEGTMPLVPAKILAHLKG